VKGQFSTVKSPNLPVENCLSAGHHHRPQPAAIMRSISWSKSNQLSSSPGSTTS
jgi:hypothetical protein